MTKTYRFYYSLGVPVFDWPTGKTVVGHKFQSSSRNVPAYSLTDATEKLAKSVLTKHGDQAKLHLEQAFVSDKLFPSRYCKEDWQEINLDAATIAAFVVGANARALLAQGET